MSRPRFFAPLVVFALAGPVAAQAPSTVEPAPRQALPAEPDTKNPLDTLFERLAASKDEEEAKGIAGLIERRWLRSGSDTADLLMNRALAAVAGQDQPLAIELLDRVLALEPKWAEAWNKRATLFYMMGDSERAISDIRETLALEPRHFGAWSGLGMIFQNAEDRKRALEAFRRALAIHPHIANIKALVERLAPEVDGRDL